MSIFNKVKISKDQAGKALEIGSETERILALILQDLQDGQIDVGEILGLVSAIASLVHIGDKKDK